MQQRTTGSTQKAISDETGVEQTVLSRWKLGRNRPEAQSVVEFARAIHRPPTEALVAAGYLRAAEVAASIEVVRPLTDLSDDDLLAEVRRRMTGARNDLTTQATTTSGPTPTEGEKNGAGNPRGKVTPLHPEDPVPDLDQVAASEGDKGPDLEPGEEDYSQDPDDHPNE